MKATVLGFRCLWMKRRRCLSLLVAAPTLASTAEPKGLFIEGLGEFRLETGRSQYGKWRDDYGNWFGNNNSTLGWHYHVPMRYLERVRA